jgi:hypothetical protein
MIFYSDDDTAFKNFLNSADDEMENFALSIAKNKSVISKLENTWQKKRLKFLGLVYDPVTNTISSETRKNNKLLWSFEKSYNTFVWLNGNTANIGFRPKGASPRNIPLDSTTQAHLASLLAYYSDLRKSYPAFQYFHSLNLGTGFRNKKLLQRFLSSTFRT